jgi:hypothetical protein
MKEQKAIPKDKNGGNQEGCEMHITRLKCSTIETFMIELFRGKHWMMQVD